MGRTLIRAKETERRIVLRKMANAKKRNGNGRCGGKYDGNYEMVSAREKEREKDYPESFYIERTDERRICGCTFLRGNANVLPSFFLSLALIPAPR